MTRLEVVTWESTKVTEQASQSWSSSQTAQLPSAEDLEHNEPIESAENNSSPELTMVRDFLGNVTHYTN